MFYKNVTAFVSFFKKRIGVSFATGAALFVGITQIWLLNNQNQLIQQQNKYIELQGFSSKTQAIQSILEGYRESSDAPLTIAQLESLGSEGFDVLLSLSASNSSLSRLAAESLVQARIADSHSQRAKIYVALAKSFIEKAKYNHIEDAGGAYYYLNLLDEYLKKTELEKGRIEHLSPELQKEAYMVTREVSITAVYYRVMKEEEKEKYSEAIAKSEGWPKNDFFGDDNDATWALIVYSEQLISVISRIDSWCHLRKDKFLTDILIENYKKTYKQRIDSKRTDVIVTHKDPWLFDEVCKNMNLFGFHEDAVEHATKERKKNTIYLDDK